MKLKGITTVEQHIEKIVLGVFLVFALAMLVMQLMRENSVDIGQGRKVTPASAGAAVSAEARQVENQLSSQTTPALPKTPALEEQFAHLVKGDADAPPLRLAERWGGGAADLVPDVVAPSTNTGDRLYTEVTPPAPTSVVAHVYEGTIDPFEQFANPELAKLLPKQQPFDSRFVSVQAMFDAAALREALKAETKDNDALPLAWIQRGVELLDVELIAADLAADGTWGPEKTIASLPGRFSMRDRVLDKNLAPKEFTDLIEKERTNRETIRRPRFFNMIAGVPWEPPAKATAGSGVDPAQAAEVKRLIRELQNKDQDIAQATKALSGPPGAPGSPIPGAPGAPGGPPPPGDDRGNRPPPPAPAPGAPGGPSPKGSRADAATSKSFQWPDIPADWLAQGGKPGGQGGGGAGGRDQAQDDRQSSEDRRRKGIEQRIEKLKTERAGIVKKLADLGFDESGAPVRSAEEVPSNSIAPTPESLNPLLDPAAPSISIWAHDLTPSPGTTRKYKLRAWITNPFFGNAAQLNDKQKPLAARAGLASADSEWSAPVTIEPETRFFVTSANESGALGKAGGRVDAKVSVEVFEFFYGYWRRASVSLDPGDQVRAEIALPDLPIFNVRADDKGQPTLVDQAPMPRRSRVVADLTYFLGLARSAGESAAGAFEVFLREPDGRIGVRNPDDEGANPVRALMTASAEAAAAGVIREPSAVERVGQPGIPGRPGGVPPQPSDDRSDPGSDSGRPRG